MMRSLPLLILILASFQACWLAGCGEDKDAPVRERYIALLNRRGPERGRIEPAGKRVHKHARILDGEKRMCMSVKQGETALFEDIPVHPGARLEFLLGRASPGGEGRGAVDVLVLSAGAGEGRHGAAADSGRMESGQAESYTFTASEGSGWEEKVQSLEAFVGQRITLAFRSSNRTVGQEVFIGNPVIQSRGIPVAPEEYPPIRMEEVVADVVAQFDQAEVLRYNPDKRPAVYPMIFDKVRRTAADEEKKGVWAMPDSEFRFPLDVPGGAYLEVSLLNYPLGDREALDGGHVAFAVQVDDEPALRISSDFINRELEEINPYDRFIHRARIDLAPWAGRKVRLGFITESDPSKPPELRAYVWWDILVKRKVAIPRRLASREHPNVMILCVDALRADHLGCYGYGRDTSANLDDFARGALVFDRAFTACSWTLPATASLFTGLYPNTHGVLGDGRDYLVDSITTLAEYLAWRGVTTAAFSANELVCGAINFDQGYGFFDEVFESADGVHKDLFAWLEEWGPFQFFTYVHYMEPHSPYSAPGKYRQHFDPEYVEKRDYSGALPRKWLTGAIERAFSREERQHLINLYDSEIHYWDLQFKALLDRLDALSLSDKTLLIVTADHGEEFFDHNALGHGITLYNECLRVPLIMKDPRMGKGMRLGDFVETTALYASVVDLLGFEPPGFTQVKSLWPLAGLSKRKAELFASTESNLFGVASRLSCVIRPPFKLIENMEGEGRELYNLQEDPGELQDLAGTGQVEEQPLKERVLRWHERTAEAFPKEWQPYTPEILERLEAVGYLGWKPR